MNRLRLFPRLCPMLAALLVVQAAQGERRFEVGIRANALHTSGTRVGDMHGIGLTASMHLADGWFVLAALDRYDYEIHDPEWMTASGLPLALPSARSVVLGLALGRRHDLPEPSLAWFWTAGIGSGFASVADVDGTAVPLVADTGSEVHLTAALGAAWVLAPQWSLTTALRAEKHYVDLRVNEGNDGRRIRESSLTPVGLYLGLDYRF